MKDDALLQLEGTEQLIAALEAAKMEEISAQQALDDLIENAAVAAALAQQQLALARDLLHTAERDRSWLQEGNRASEDVIDESKAKLVLANDAIDEAKSRYDKVSDRSADDPIRATALANLSAARQRRDSALRAFNWYTGKPTEIDQAKLDADVAVAEAQLENATLKWEKVKDGPDPDARALAEARLATAKAQRAAAQAALDQLTLNAPFDGTVTEIIPNPNEWVAPGLPVASIANLASLRVETTDLSEIDASQVSEGDRATVTFDALPDVTSTGTVVYISPKASEGAGVNFKVIIVLDELPEAVRWGMTAFVDIETEM
jgi:HlyD family secretion protein